MAEEIIIGKLIIDTSDLESSMASSKKSIIDLENEQKKLKKDTEGLSTANEQQLQSFIANENELKKIKAEYSANQKSVLDLTRAQTGLDAALSQQNKTQAQATANTKELTAARRLIDSTTNEGAKAIADINTKIDANNKLVADNGSKQEKAATITGNYRQKIFELGNSFGGASGQAIGFVQQSREVISSLSEVNDLVSNSVKNIIGFGNASNISARSAATLAGSQTAVGASTEIASVGTNAATRSTWLLNTALGTLLLPITAVIAAIVIIVAVFSQFQPVVDKVEQAFAALQAVFNVIKNTILALVTGAKSLKEAFSGLGGEMAGAAKEAANLKKAQQDLADSMEQQEVSTARARAEINKLNAALLNKTLGDEARAKIADTIAKKETALFLIRQNEVNTQIAQAKQDLAIKAGLSKDERGILDQGSKAIKDNLEKRTSNVDKEVELLNSLRLKAIELENERTENTIKAYNKRDKFEEKAKEAQDKRQTDAQEQGKKNTEASLKNSQIEIDILKAQGQARNLDASQRIALAQKVFDLENNLAQRSLSGSDLTKAQIIARQTLSSAILEITDEQISKEADAQKRSVEQTKAINVELYDSQSQNANDLAKAQLLLLDKKVLSERDYANEVARINQIKNETLTSIQTNFDAAEVVRRETARLNEASLEEVSFQLRLQDITDRDATEQEIKLALLTANYDNDLVLLQEQLDKEKEVYGLSKEQLTFLDDKYAKDKSLIEKKYNAETKKNDKALAAQKQANNVDMVQQGIGALQALFGESKALSVASALVNTYEGITAALKAPTITQRIIGVTFATSTGFAAVKNILKTNKGSSSVDSGGGGGASGGRSQTTSGAGAFVNNAQTETVARASDTPTAQNIVVTPPVLILEQLNEANNNLNIKLASG